MPEKMDLTAEKNHGTMRLNQIPTKTLGIKFK